VNPRESLPRIIRAAHKLVNATRPFRKLRFHGSMNLQLQGCPISAGVSALIGGVRELAPAFLTIHNPDVVVVPQTTKMVSFGISDLRNAIFVSPVF
jgi:hypothetical protein